MNGGTEAAQPRRVPLRPGVVPALDPIDAGPCLPA